MQEIPVICTPHLLSHNHPHDCPKTHAHSSVYKTSRVSPCRLSQAGVSSLSQPPQLREEERHVCSATEGPHICLPWMMPFMRGCSPCLTPSYSPISSSIPVIRPTRYRPPSPSFTRAACLSPLMTCRPSTRILRTTIPRSLVPFLLLYA